MTPEFTRVLKAQCLMSLKIKVCLLGPLNNRVLHCRHSCQTFENKWKSADSCGNFPSIICIYKLLVELICISNVHIAYGEAKVTWLMRLCGLWGASCEYCTLCPPSLWEIPDLTCLDWLQLCGGAHGFIQPWYIITRKDALSEYGSLMLSAPPPAFPERRVKARPFTGSLNTTSMFPLYPSVCAISVLIL